LATVAVRGRVLSPPFRRLALAVHLSCSVGWLGAVVAYLVLDLTVATSKDDAAVRSAWTAMGLVVSWAIVPLALASVLTGLVIALGTKWGLFRHWWVLVSFVLTVLATVVLLSEAGVVTRSAAIAAASTTAVELRSLPPTLPHSIGGLGVLLVVQVLNIYKPQGVTPYGWRKQQEERRLRASAARSALTSSDLEEPR
jgi:hypothetical protein